MLLQNLFGAVRISVAEVSIYFLPIAHVTFVFKRPGFRYDSSKGMESLDMMWVSRANAQQRKGRAGRVAPGICFHLFTSYRYEYRLRDQPVPGKSLPPSTFSLMLETESILGNQGKRVKSRAGDFPIPIVLLFGQRYREFHWNERF